MFAGGKYRALASPVALAPGELGALTQPRSPTRETYVAVNIRRGQLPEP